MREFGENIILKFKKKCYYNTQESFEITHWKTFTKKHAKGPQLSQLFRGKILIVQAADEQGIIL